MVKWKYEQDFLQGTGYILVSSKLIKNDSYPNLEMFGLRLSLKFLLSELYLEGENNHKIVIAYARGNKHFSGSDGNDVGGSFLFGGPVLSPREPERSSKLSSFKNSNPFSNDFHVYSLRWTPGRNSHLIEPL